MRRAREAIQKQSCTAMIVNDSQILAQPQDRHPPPQSAQAFAELICLVAFSVWPR